MEPKLPRGFRFAGAACGLKQSKANDIALIVADHPCVAAGVYTQNVVRAPSIGWNESITPTESARGIVVNSGNANACTGSVGEQNNRTMAELAATAIASDVSPEQVLVLSTGVIGVQLAMDKVRTGIETAAEGLGESNENFIQAIDGIRTTDKDRKFVIKSFASSDQSFQIAAMAKGAGMIGPRMATLLSIVTTDFPMTSATAQRLLKDSVDKSFNRISVEGHTSTNDAVILFCPPADADSGDLSGFAISLNESCVELAKMIPADGEGSTHLVEIEVTGAIDDETADKVARVIAGSNLVKTAITGADPNWGRIVSAIGIFDIEVDHDAIGLGINGFQVFAKGQPLEFDTANVSKSIAANFETKLKITLGSGNGNAIHWTSDLTVDYVRFNSEYTT